MIFSAKKRIGLLLLVSLSLITSGKNIPGEDLRAIPVKDGLTLLQDIQEYRVGYQYSNDKPSCWMPVGWSGNFTYDTGIAFYPAESNSRKAFLLQSPWRKKGTERLTWVDYKLTLPEKGKISFAFGYAMADNARVRQWSDGVTFSASVFADGKEEKLLEQHYNSSKWIDSEYDLSKYAGKTVVIRLQVGPGPKNSASYDWSYFSLPRVIVEQNDFTCWNVPDKKFLSPEYQVEINGKSADVFLVKVEGPEFTKIQKKYQIEGGDYSFLQFDLSKPVRIRIRSKQKLNRAQILPRFKNVPMFPMGENAVDLVIDRPMQISFEPNGQKHPLLIFANPVSTVPDKNTPNLISFGPGVHNPPNNKIVLKDNTTLYLAGGAVVQAGVIVKGKNIRICGRGVLDGTPWPKKKGPTPDMLQVRGSEDLTIEGIIIQGAWHWTLPIYNSCNVKIDNIKICGGRLTNDDGINPCNAQNVQVRNSFIRTIDDCIAPKGMKREWGNVENMLFENMVLWTGASRSVVLGHESQAEYMRNFTFRNIDIIHFNQYIFLLQPGEDMILENIVFKNVRINGENKKKMCYAAQINGANHRYTWLNAGKTLKRVPGHVKNVLFENLFIHGQNAEKKFIFTMNGNGPKYMVEDVVFRNVFLNGIALTKESPVFFVGGCRNIKTENIQESR